MNVDETLKLLKDQKANFRCSELCQVMRSLGFTVEITQKGHWKVKHGGLVGFRGSGFACGHGKNGKVEKCYINNMRQVIQEHKLDLKSILDKK